jgi:hypothetical protein
MPVHYSLHNSFKFSSGLKYIVHYLILLNSRSKTAGAVCLKKKYISEIIDIFQQQIDIKATKYAKPQVQQFLTMQCE